MKAIKWAKVHGDSRKAAVPGARHISVWIIFEWSDFFGVDACILLDGIKCVANRVPACAGRREN